MTYLSVKNWEEFQHYNDRSPPWIKLYNRLLDDYEFGALPDATKWHLAAIWLLASRSGNRIPHDSQWISRRINASKTVDVKALIDAGFLIVNQEVQGLEQNASTPLATCSPEKSRDRERERDRGEKKTNSTTLSELMTVLDEEHARAVIEHRQRLRKSLSLRAAKLLASKLGRWPDPNFAADEMIANGWQGFDPAWLEGRAPQGQSPPQQHPLAQAMDRISERRRNPNEPTRQDPNIVDLEEGRDFSVRTRA